MTTSHFGLYTIHFSGQVEAADADLIISTAIRCLESRITRSGQLSSPADARALVTLRLGGLEHEVFAVIFLDAQHRVIELREMFRGSLTQTSVYPREVVKAALSLNAAAVILAHNHPSGVPEPSRADEFLTRSLQSALALVDVKVLDHLIVGGGKVTSFAERGLM